MSCSVAFAALNNQVAIRFCKGAGVFVELSFQELFCGVKGCIRL